MAPEDPPRLSKDPSKTPHRPSKRRPKTPQDLPKTLPRPVQDPPSIPAGAAKNACENWGPVAPWWPQFSRAFFVAPAGTLHSQKLSKDSLQTPRKGILEPLGAILGASWDFLEISWAHLGAPWVHLGASWGFLASSWEPLGAFFGFKIRDWNLLGSKLGGKQGPSCTVLEAKLTVLRPTWEHLGTTH